MSAAVRLPASTAALLFDMDGVLTDTAVVHARAWGETFDAVLAKIGAGPPFDRQADYEAHVDGRSRLDGVRAFLESRGIELPEGTPDDPPGALTVRGIGRRKNDLVLQLIRQGGVHAYPGSVSFLRDARGRGLGCALVTSSANAHEALRTAGLEDCFDAWVDGVRIDAEQLPGKPRPDTFLAAAADLGVPVERAVVLEDALAGVEAGRAGGFGCVVGVDRTGRADALRAHGADVVVGDLSELALP
jgi:beta-phosphoglucomutase family hydrolase